METKKQLRICVITNFILLCIIIIPVILFNDGSSKYFRIGWYDDLILVSIPINTSYKYILLTIFIAFIKTLEVIIGEIAHPIIGFNIYNPDKKIITDFSKNELQLYGNLMYIIEGFKRIIMLMITISQFDLALISMLFGEITTIFTIRYLLNQKTFCENEEECEKLI